MAFVQNFRIRVDNSGAVRPGQIRPLDGSQIRCQTGQFHLFFAGQATTGQSAGAVSSTSTPYSSSHLEPQLASLCILLLG